MEKNNYSTPECEIVKTEGIDIITDSNVIIMPPDPIGRGPHSGVYPEL